MKACALLVVIAACSANDDLPSPQISSITPSHATAGTIVVIAGSYFCHQPANEDPLACDHVGAVHFGATVANAALYSDDQIMAEVPSASGQVDVVVEVEGHLSNAVSFTVD
jgi:hypothetical protein